MFSANAEALVDVPFGGSLRAGFPSPAQDYTSEAINLGKILVRDNETTFYARVEGNSMCEAGICDGDGKAEKRSASSDRYIQGCQI